MITGIGHSRQTKILYLLPVGAHIAFSDLYHQKIHILELIYAECAGFGLASIKRDEHTTPQTFF
jgi:hypothetical protein